MSKMTKMLPDDRDDLDRHLQDVVVGADHFVADGHDSLQLDFGRGNGGDDIDQLVAPGTSASSDEIDDFSDGVDGATPILGMPIAQATCQTVCQGYGKVWDYTSANFGTCAFNKVVAVQAPEHEVGGAACTGPNTQRWTLNGGVLFDCGCRCV